MREKEVDDGESTGGEEGETYVCTERGFASEPQRTGGSKVCAQHHNGHPVTNTDEPVACDAPFHGAVYFVGKQVVAAWKSMHVSPSFYSAAQHSTRLTAASPAKKRKKETKPVT